MKKNGEELSKYFDECKSVRFSLITEVATSSMDKRNILAYSPVAIILLTSKYPSSIANKVAGNITEWKGTLSFAMNS